MPFKKGQSGNPKGKQVGRRDRINQKFLHVLAKDFEEHGEGTIAKVRETDPSTYFKVLAGLLPKEATLNVNFLEELESIPDDELASRIRELERLTAILRPIAGGGSQEETESPPKLLS